MGSGQGWRRTAKASVAIKAGPVRTTGGSWRRCFGSCAPVSRGVICPLSSATGRASSRASGRGEGGRLQASVRCRLGRAGHGIRHDRRHDRPCLSSRPRRKRGTCRQAIGKSKGGWTTKIVALTDALGNLVRFELLPGHRYDTVGVAALIDGLAFDALFADKAYDSNSLVEDLDDRGAKVVISQRPNAWRPALSTRPCMDGAISSRTSSAASRTSNA